jgi:hypothetical protein
MQSASLDFFGFPSLGQSMRVECLLILGSLEADST